MIYIGIVGSRKRSEFKEIYRIINNFIKHGYNITIVSGGAVGIDTNAEDVAKTLNIPLIIYRPKRSEYKTKGNDIYFERNRLIAEKIDFLYAFPLNRSGGTMNTIKHFIELKSKSRLFIND